MKRLAILALALAPLAGAGAAQAADPPDYKLRCKNGNFAKVWVSPLKVINNCADHSKQWVEVHVDSYPEMDNDPYILSVAAGAKYIPQYKWNIPVQYVRVRLGRGVFCHVFNEDGSEIDVEVVYRKGGTWRAKCDS